MMTVHMDRDQRNQLTAQHTLRHLEMIEKLMPEGITVDRRIDHELTRCYGRAVVNSVQREYDLLGPMGVVPIRGPFEDNLPDSQLRQHFSTELHYVCFRLEGGDASSDSY
jgi:hypothetical protein